MDIIQQVEQALETIRPYLIADGGDVAIEEITSDNVVRLKLLGNCGSCKMSFMTMMGVRRSDPQGGHNNY